MRVQVCVMVAIIVASTPSDAAACLSSGILCYPSDCHPLFQQYVGANYYPPQGVVPGAVCYQGTIINASDPRCENVVGTTMGGSTSISGVISTSGVVSTSGGSTTGSTTGDSVLSNTLSRKDFNTLFPYANGAAARGDSDQYAIFSYDNLIEASKSFPEFAGTGNTTIRQREVAAFLAQTSHETSGWWLGQPFVWGYYFSTEECDEDYEDCGYCSPDTQYPCVEGESYYGRGPIQLSWNYNYGPASEAILGNKSSLLDNPDMLLQNGTIAFQAALWFWMTDQPPKPSPHNIITGNWTPSATDLAEGRTVGFGMITNIINGGIECNITTPLTVTSRVGYYETYCDYFQIADGGNLYCDDMLKYS